MTDIVERLLDPEDMDEYHDVRREAAAEIERLRAEIRQIELNTREGSPLILKINWVARRALEPKP